MDPIGYEFGSFECKVGLDWGGFHLDDATWEVSTFT